jgi:Methyltransferase domain
MDLSERRGVSSRRHPWEKARATFFRRVLQQARPYSQPLTVLDVGAGDGYLAAELFSDLPTGSRLVCFDSNYSDADLATYAAATPPGVSFVRDRPREVFDVILLLDVMEHVPDDDAFLRGLTTENLGEGGTVVVSVPALQSLFSKHDEALGHHRRYSPTDLRRVVAANGLVVLKAGGLFHSLLFPRTWSVVRERFLRFLAKEPPLPPTADDWNAGKWVSKGVEKLLEFDNALSHAASELGWQMPGLSVWAICQRGRPG